MIIISWSHHHHHHQNAVPNRTVRSHNSYIERDSQHEDVVKDVVKDAVAVEGVSRREHAYHRRNRSRHRGEMSVTAGGVIGCARVTASTPAAHIILPTGESRPFSKEGRGQRPLPPPQQGSALFGVFPERRRAT